MARCQLFPLAVFAALAVGACGGDGPSGPTTGTLAITATGIPSGVSLDVTVTGPGGLREEIAAPATLDNLRPGDYQVDAATVQAGASWYAPDPPTRTVSVTAGATATAAIAFDNVATEAVNFTVEAAYLTQSIQTTAGTVSLVRGRDALLRVFVRADRAGAAAPPVRVRLFAGGTLRQTLLLAPPAIAPQSIEEAELSRSWNVIVPGSSLEPGFALLADVDPDNQIAEGFETDNVFPATGQPQPVSVRVSPPLRIRFIPIQSTNGLGTVSAATTAAFLDLTRRMHPLVSVDADVRGVYTTVETLISNSTPQGTEPWLRLIGEIEALRVAEGTDRYYYGVVRTSGTGRPSGVGFAPGRTVLGYDVFPRAATIAAHELGHNWGRLHAPCGGPASVDPGYPHPGGTIGAHGFDVSLSAIKHPSLTDVMSYCNDQWISDYTYQHVLDYREANDAPVAPDPVAAVPSLVVWGRISSGQLVLEPAFSVTAPPSLPRQSGDYRVEGFTAAGAPLFSLSFEPLRVADVEGDERIFAFAVPMNASAMSQVASLQLSGRGRVALRAALGTGGDVLARRSGRTERMADGRLGVSWDASAFPLAVVRDARTGEILSLARGGRAALPAEHPAVVVELSDGVRTRALAPD